MLRFCDRTQSFFCVCPFGTSWLPNILQGLQQSIRLEACTHIHFWVSFLLTGVCRLFLFTATCVQSVQWIVAVYQPRQMTADTEHCREDPQTPIKAPQLCFYQWLAPTRWLSQCHPDVSWVYTGNKFMQPHAQCTYSMCTPSYILTRFNLHFEACVCACVLT